MPLNDGYGVAIGDFVSITRDNPNNFGQYFHGHITIRVPSGNGFAQITSAIDVNKPNGGVQYFVPTNMDAARFNTINALSDGYHALASNAGSGALDYKRNELISVPLGCLALTFIFLHLLTHDELRQPWTTNVGTTALDQLEALFAHPDQIAKVYLFGEPYPHGWTGLPQGLHNVHCNQGDPLPAPGEANYAQKLGWYNAGGIYQDGGVIVKYNDGRLAGFFVKFITQTLNTGNDGHPL